MKKSTKVIRNWFGYQRKLERKEKKIQSKLKTENVAHQNQCFNHQNLISQQIPIYNFGLSNFIQQANLPQMNIFGLGYLLVPRTSNMFPRNFIQNCYNFF